MTFTPDPWEAPARGHWRRDFRLAEWLPAPLSPSFETWLLPLLEAGYRDGCQELFGYTVSERLHVTVNGWYFTNEGTIEAPLRAFARHPRSMLSQGMALATFPTKPERAERVLAAPGRRFLDDVAKPALADAIDRAREQDAADPVAGVDLLGRASGALLVPMVTTLGFASKAEFALARFLRTNLPDEQRVSHLVLLAGVVAPHAPQTHDVVSLDWVEPTFGEWPNDDTDLDEARERHERLRAGADTAAERCREALSPSKATRFDELLAVAQGAILERDGIAGVMTQAWPELRRAMAGVGTRLVEAGVVAEAADAYFLEHDEIVAALDGDRTPHQNHVIERRMRREAQRRLAAPLSLGPASGPWKQEGKFLDTLREPLSDGLTAVVQGVPTSAGVAEGAVRVVLGVDDFAALEPGEILVAPVTAPAWTPLFAIAAAVVTDGGSPFSHTSVVAREFAIPAVVGTGDATARLRTGDQVRVDGRTGAVTALGAGR